MIPRAGTRKEAKEEEDEEPLDVIPQAGPSGTVTRKEAEEEEEDEEVEEVVVVEGKDTETETETETNSSLYDPTWTPRTGI